MFPVSRFLCSSASRSDQQKPARRNALLSVGGASEEQLEERCMLATYYVANNGNNGNNGKSTSKPFKTIQKAADVAKAGDRVLIRGGTYREQVQVRRSGTNAKPIKFEAFKNEKVVISALAKVKSKAVVVNGNVSRYSLSSTIGASVKDGTKNGDILKNRQGLTVFNKNTVLQEARRNNKAKQLNSNTWSRFDTGTNGSRLVDNDGRFSKNLIGSYLLIKINNFTFDRRRVVGVPNNKTLVLNEPFRQKELKENNPYMLLDNRSFVDTAGEWYFSEEENNLYVFGKHSPGTIEVKVRKEGFVTNNHNFLRFKNLRFVGGDLDLGTSNNIGINGIIVNASDRNSGDFVKGTGAGGVLALVLRGKNNTVRNSTFNNLWQAAVRVPGADNRIVNNKFLNSGLGNGAGGVALSKEGPRTLVSYNTFVNMGRMAIAGKPNQAVVEHNYFEKTNLLSNDSGAIYIGKVVDLKETIFRRNIFNNIRGAFTGGIYIDNNGSNAVIHNNIVVNSDFGIITNRPNKNIRIYNNTVHASVGNSIFAGGNGARNGPAENSRVFNNIFLKIARNLTSEPGAVKLAGNVKVTDSSPFVNVAKRDFRLKAGSAPIDKGVVIKGVTDGFTGSKPDAGAIEFGRAMFIAGANFAKPPAESKLRYRWKKLP